MTSEELVIVCSTLTTIGYNSKGSIYFPTIFLKLNFINTLSRDLAN